MITENYELLQEFIDNTSELIFQLSASGEFLFLNNATLDILKYNKKELLGKNINELIHPEYKESILKNFDRVRNGERIQDFILVLRNINKKRIYLMGELTCKFQKGEAVSFRCMFRDITQRRRAEIAQNLYHSIAQINLTSKTLEDFLQKVHYDLQKNIYANNFFVAIYEASDNSIYFPYRVDEKDLPGETYTKRNLGNGLIEYIMVQNKSMVFLKKELQELLEKENLYMYDSEIPEVTALVPLKINEKTIGVIGIKSYSDATKFSDNDLALMEFVSGQIAISMERKKAEEKLLRQTARLNAIFDSSTHYIWTVNQKRQLSSFNKNYYNLIFEKLGLTPDLGNSVEKLGWRLIATEDKPFIREKYTLAFGGIPQYFEMHWGEIDGGSDWYEFYLNPILSSETGEIDEVSGIARNITEKKIAVLNIEKSERKFRDIIDSFIDIYYKQI